ncbi:MAG: 30S ribosomal protein S4 [Theionarchaea archaeon]|nr:MAG: 30S ribosomal protein S4 [Theionarchaea archaeon DG-70-1]MBU7027659.1 30S ribosomal protein S4 [Theionarchaea archaeon]
MGDPRKQRKSYDTPSHPWRKDRIEKEKELVRKYGLKNKKDIWKAESKLRQIRRIARNLLSSHGEQAKKEEAQLMSKLQKLGLLKGEADLDSVLGLTIEDILERRLQSLVHRKGLSRSPKQARQLVVHGHIRVGGRRIKSPSYLVPVEQEETIISEVA